MLIESSLQFVLFFVLCYKAAPRSTPSEVKAWGVFLRVIYHAYLHAFFFGELYTLYKDSDKITYIKINR